MVVCVGRARRQRLVEDDRARCTEPPRRRSQQRRPVGRPLRDLEGDRLAAERDAHRAGTRRPLIAAAAAGGGSRPSIRERGRRPRFRPGRARSPSRGPVSVRSRRPDCRAPARRRQQLAAARPVVAPPAAAARRRRCSVVTRLAGDRSGPRQRSRSGEQRHLEHRRAAKARERVEEQRPVEPAEPEQREEEH